MSEPRVPASWADLGFFQRDWPALWEKLSAESGWQPAPEHLFRALDLCPREKTRVVILGQDPYPTLGRAQGLAFSFPPDARPRDSLKNILTELEADLGITKTDGDLAGWARQGVLLLNTVLSVPVGQAFGHKAYGWTRLAEEVLAATHNDGPRAFALWGQPAQKLCARLARRPQDLFLESPHPSPLSARRGFYGSRPFSKINTWLTAQGQPPIDWGA